MNSTRGFVQGFTHVVHIFYTSHRLSPLFRQSVLGGESLVLGRF